MKHKGDQKHLVYYIQDNEEKQKCPRYIILQQWIDGLNREIWNINKNIIKFFALIIKCFFYIIIVFFLNFAPSNKLSSHNQKQ